MPTAGGRLYELLLHHGVPERGARLYLAACREGPQTASELARMTGMHRVEAYRFIRQLEVSGLLRTEGRGPMRFAALPPEALLDRWIRAATERLRRLEADRTGALADLDSGLLDLNAEGSRKFAVIEGQEEIYRFVNRRIGTAKSEIRASVPGLALGLAINGGVDRAMRKAHERGVKIQILTDIHHATRSEAKHFGSFADVRHSVHPLTARSMVIDRAGALAYVSGPEGIGGTSTSQVAVWSGSPSFRSITDDYLRGLWRHAVPADRRFVEIESPRSAVLPMHTAGDRETFLRLQEIAALGMKTTGIDTLRFDLPELIGAIGRQIGHQVSENLSGETPEEVARSLADYYTQNALGHLEVARARPLTLKVTNCFACVRHSTEIGRRLCPMIFKSALEDQLGGEYDVSAPDPTRHAQRGCLFTVARS